MTDLTEQWKKGELPNGYYWIRLSWGGMVIMAYYTGFDGLFELDDHYYDSDEISEVLAPVPSYEEWQASYNCMLENEVLRLKNAQLKEILERHKKATAKAQIRSCDLEIINAELKELLKAWVQFEIEENPNDFTVMSERMSELANKTKEVLK